MDDALDKIAQLEEALEGYAVLVRVLVRRDHERDPAFWVKQMEALERMADDEDDEVALMAENQIRILQGALQTD